jgi:hypothetical protein
MSGQPPYSLGTQQQRVQLEADVRAVVLALERLTSLRSKWNGNALFSDAMVYEGVPRLGLKSPGCSIEINIGIVEQHSRYSTIVHEAFHSISNGYAERCSVCGIPYYDHFPGFEEGVVEQCTRLKRVDILERAGIIPKMLTQDQLVPRTSYNRAIKVMEELRAYCSRSEEDFYPTLLKTPLKDRIETVQRGSQEANPEKSPHQVNEELAPRIQKLITSAIVQQCAQKGQRP